MADGTKRGAHAWVICLIDGTWMTDDGTSAEAGVAQPMTISAHEHRWGISSVANNTDSIKVAKVLVEASLLTARI